MLRAALKNLVQIFYDELYFNKYPNKQVNIRR